MSDQKGDISLSVDETNKMRAELGLKPLRTDKEETPEEGHRKNPLNYLELKEKEEKRKEKERAEKKRKLREGGNAATSSSKDVYKEGKTMEEALEDETDNAADWANQHRWKKLRAARKKQQEEQATGTNAEDNLSGLKVGHDFEQFREGEDVTLVMGDAPILDEKGELNLEEGELENVLWKDKNRYKKWQDIKNDPARAGYDPSLDQFEIGAGGQPVKRLLAQYDEKPVEERGFTLGQRQAELQSLAPEERLKLLNAEAEMAAKEANATTMYDREGVKFSLNHGGLKFQSDYLTSEETKVIEFKKNKKNKKKRKKEKDEEEPKEQNFKMLERPEGCDSDEEDPELYEILRKQRKVVNVEPEKREVKKPSTKELIDEVKNKEAEMSDVEEEDQGVTITDTTQFCKSVETAVEKVESLKTETYQGANLYKAQVQQKRKQMRGVKISKEKDKKKEKDKAAEIKAAIEADSDNEDAGMAETPLDMSVGSALEYLRARDQIGNDQDTCRKRNKEHRPLETSTDDGDIKLEYRDKFGRVQNAKEAFRTISWKFHGKMPGHKNYERRLQRYEREMVLRQKADKDLPTQRALEAVQRNEHKAHMVLGTEK